MQRITNDNFHIEIEANLHFLIGDVTLIMKKVCELLFIKYCFMHHTAALMRLKLYELLVSKN